MEPEKSSADWNEIGFLSWEEFKKMGPSIIQLEISRVSQLIKTYGIDSNFHNALVSSRFELKKFIECLTQADKENVESYCSSHLQTAILSLSFSDVRRDDRLLQTVDYILDRLNYVFKRIQLIY